MPDCMCEIIQYAYEPGEIEFCPLHKGAARMLMLLGDIKDEASGYANAAGHRHPAQTAFKRLEHLADTGIKAASVNAETRRLVMEDAETASSEELGAASQMLDKLIEDN